MKRRRLFKFLASLPVALFASHKLSANEDEKGDGIAYIVEFKHSLGWVPCKAAHNRAFAEEVSLPLVKRECPPFEYRIRKYKAVE